MKNNYVAIMITLAKHLWFRLSQEALNSVQESWILSGCRESFDVSPG